MAKKSTKIKDLVGEVKSREIVQEMKESYIDYAMSVIVSRALPDVRDGLKPVQRRILYTMYEMGLKHNVKFRKSAAVIGLILGRYHPHGDASVYAAMARMTQDFSLRYPLVKGQGNWGSIDDPSEVAAMRYCITGDSFVVTNRCLERIGEISTQENISLKVLSFDGKKNSASKWFDSGIHPVVKIQTLRGYSLKGTHNHPILVLESNKKAKPVFRWKLLSQIKKGDFAVVDRNKKVLWPQKEPNLKKHYPKTEKRRFRLYQLPAYMSPDLAFILGAVLAEGYVSHKKSREKCIGFCNTDQEFINTFKLSFKKVFPGCPVHEFKRGPLGYGKKPFTALEIHSTHITEFLENLGLKKSLACKKKIPEIIFHSTKKSTAAFLKGFVEGDGSISTFRYGRSPDIVFLSTSKKLLQEIQLLLLRFGLDSFLRLDKGRNLWRLFIRGRDNFVLFNTIGFVSEKKRKRLKKYYQINKDYRIMSKTDFVPFLSNYLRKKYKSREIRQVFKNWLKGHNLDRYTKLKKYYSAIKQFLDQEDLELINYFLKQHYLFDKIVSIEDCEQEKVYSFRVDSKCHSFVSNGFISHNTEAKLSKTGEELLKDIEKDTVGLIDNYDGTRKQPLVLPAPLPNLLLNGCLGIAVGMATNIPPHNLTEVCQAAVYFIDHPQATTEDLFQHIQGPDFPTGGIIYNKDAIITAYSQGKGPIVLRGRADIIETKNGTQIVVSEIPFNMRKSALIEQIANLVQNKKIKGVKDIRDESDREGMRIVLDLKQGVVAKRILNHLYKATSLQTTFHLNTIALVDGIQPKVLSLPDILEHFIEHRKKVVFRRTRFDLKKASQREHILEGLDKALKRIDAVIKTIKASKNRQEAEKNLIKEFKLTKIQANAILEMKLSALARLEREKISQELKEIKKLIEQLSAILKSKKKIEEIIKKELNDYKEKFGDERKTKVLSRQIKEITLDDLIAQQPAVITLTQKGFVKRLRPSVLRVQKRGGKGVIGQKTVGDDIVEHLIFAQTRDHLLFFTDSGKVFKTRVFEIPEADRTARGKSLLNFLEISSNEKILALIPQPKDGSQDSCLVMVTKNGIIKKTKISAFENVRKTGLIAIKLKKDDLLRKVSKSSGEDEIMLITQKGQSIRMKEKDVRPMGRTAAGVKGIRLKKEDEVVGMEIIEKSKAKRGKDYLLIITENGYGKRTALSEYRMQRRGGAGIKTANITKKTGQIIASKLLTGQEKHLIAISQHGQVIKIKIFGISKIGRATQGVKIMRLDKYDKVASVVVI